MVRVIFIQKSYLHFCRQCSGFSGWWFIMVEQVLTNFDKDLLFFKLIEFVFVCRLPNYCEKVCFIWKFEDRIFRFLFSEAICFYCYVL